MPPFTFFLTTPPPLPNQIVDAQHAIAQIIWNKEMISPAMTAHATYIDQRRDTNATQQL